MSDPQEFWNASAGNYDRTEERFEYIHQRSRERARRHLSLDDVVLDYGSHAASACTSSLRDQSNPDSDPQRRPCRSGRPTGPERRFRDRGCRDDLQGHLQLLPGRQEASPEVDEARCNRSFRRLAALTYSPPDPGAVAPGYCPAPLRGSTTRETNANTCSNVGTSQVVPSQKDPLRIQKKNPQKQAVGVNGERGSKGERTDQGKAVCPRTRSKSQQPQPVGKSKNAFPCWVLSPLIRGPVCQDDPQRRLNREQFQKRRSRRAAESSFQEPPRSGE